MIQRTKRALLLTTLALALVGCEAAMTWQSQAYQDLTTYRCETQEQRDRAFAEAEWCAEHTGQGGLWCYAMAARRNCTPTTEED